MFDILEQLYSWIVFNYIEFIAVIAGIIGVWLTAKQIIWCWPVAIVNVVLSAYIFYGTKLYQDGILQLFYLIMAIYGWYNWKFGGKNKTELKVSRTSFRTAILLLIIGFISIYVFGYLFKRYTDAALPYWDATTTVWGVIATFMMAKKMIENWAIWILIDLLNTAIYFYKGLYGFVFLYFVFTILAVFGLMQWLKDYRKIESI
ncbi:MAG: nicotinamide mononucleotide transporter [Bacteroidetes bacterium]|nr:nicotinamide mononucleotide transporter [Bacteroidota bacterium]